MFFIDLKHTTFLVLANDSGFEKFQFMHKINPRIICRNYRLRGRKYKYKYNRLALGRLGLVRKRGFCHLNHLSGTLPNCSFNIHDCKNTTANTI